MKICNFRPLCFIALLVTVTLLLTVFSVWVGVTFITVAGVGLTVTKTPRWFKIAPVVICSICCISYIIVTTIYSNTRELYGEAGDLTGVVESYNERNFVLRNVKYKGDKVGGKVQIWLYGDAETAFETTHKITIKDVKLYSAKASAANINNRITYTANIYTNTCILDNGFDKGVRSSILRHSKRYLSAFLSADNADIVSAMLFGDKSSMDDEMRDGFAAAGLSHALAVSGLHVGLIIWILFIILRLCRCPKKYRLYIVIPILLFYAYLCGWRYSILRAVIMFLTYYAVRTVQWRADPFSALSLSAVVILLLFPYSLFSASFLLSFACMFGIILYYEFFKSKLYNSAVAMYLSVTVATLPLSFYYFGFASAYGIISAVILLPILVFSFVSGFLSLITVIGGVSLYVAEPLLSFVRKVTTAIGSLPTAKIEISADNIGFIFYYLALIVFSRFIFVQRSWRWGIGVTAFACYLITFAL
jgi:ComEC/Rec2-related protein